jgi:hypothetical protein
MPGKQAKLRRYIGQTDISPEVFSIACGEVRPVTKP